MHIEYLKVAGVLASLVGTIVLAVRVTKILSVLSIAATMTDLNMQIEAERANGNHYLPHIRMYGTSTHIAGVERLGNKLLILGFSLQILGGACTAASFLL